MTPDSGSALALTEEARNQIFEKFWAIGGNYFIYGSFDDIHSNKQANDIVAEFIRSKIRETVKDPETAQKLLPLDHPYGSKRALMDTNYFETYNRDNVDLVDLRQAPIEEITSTGIRTSESGIRIRYHSLRHGIRRYDRHLYEDGYPRPRRPNASRKMGRRPEDLLRSPGVRLPPTCSCSRVPGALPCFAICPCALNST